MSTPISYLLGLLETLNPKPVDISERRKHSRFLEMWLKSAKIEMYVDQEMSIVTLSELIRRLDGFYKPRSMASPAVNDVDGFVICIHHALDNVHFILYLPGL